MALLAHLESLEKRVRSNDIPYEVLERGRDRLLDAVEHSRSFVPLCRTSLYSRCGCGRSHVRVHRAVLDDWVKDGSDGGARGAGEWRSRP